MQVNDANLELCATESILYECKENQREMKARQNDIQRENE